MTSVSSSQFSPLLSTQPAALATRFARSGAAATDETPAPAAGSLPAQPDADTSATTAAPNKAELERQLQALQQKMDKLNPALSFLVDHSHGQVVVQLTDRSTKEVIHQFPTDAVMQISKALDRFEKGLLLRRKA